MLPCLVFYNVITLTLLSQWTWRKIMSLQTVFQKLIQVRLLWLWRRKLYDQWILHLLLFEYSFGEFSLLISYLTPYKWKSFRVYSDNSWVSKLIWWWEMLSYIPFAPTDLKRNWLNLRCTRKHGWVLRSNLPSWK